jgi:hypothetical protein
MVLLGCRQRAAASTTLDGVTASRRISARRVRLVATLWVALFVIAAFVVWNQVSVVDYMQNRPSASFGTISVCIGPIVHGAPSCLGEVHPGPLEVLWRSAAAATLATVGLLLVGQLIARRVGPGLRQLG